MVRRLYEKLGCEPADLLQISPVDGGWENALSYDVKRKDGKQAKIYRRDLDDRNETALTTALRGFK